MLVVFRNQLNSLRPGDAYRSRWTWLSWLVVWPVSVTSDKLLPEQMPTVKTNNVNFRWTKCNVLPKWPELLACEAWPKSRSIQCHRLHIFAHYRLCWEEIYAHVLYRRVTLPMIPQKRSAYFIVYDITVGSSLIFQEMSSSHSWVYTSLILCHITWWVHCSKH